MVTRPVSSIETNAVGLKRGTSTAAAAGGAAGRPMRQQAQSDDDAAGGDGAADEKAAPAEVLQDGRHVTRLPAAALIAARMR